MQTGGNDAEQAFPGEEPAADVQPEQPAGQDKAVGEEEITDEKPMSEAAVGQETAAKEDAGDAEASTDSVNENVPAEPSNIAAPALSSLAADVEGKIAQMKLEVFDDLDAGYGDSQMLSSGGQRLMIDTDYSGAWDVLNDWLNSRQYTDFDIYISHYHDDHMGNVENILNDGKYKVNKLYLPDYGYMTGSSGYMQDYIAECESMMNTARNKGVEIVYLAKGSIFNVGDVTAQVLWGADYKHSTHNTNYINNNSLVTRFTCGNIRYLNAGDIEKPTENELLNNDVDLAADIFKLNHHGGDTSNKYEFIEAVNAAYYYYTYCEDSPTRYSPYNTWTYDSVQNAKQFGNVASVRYNGNITYNVYDNVITQELERNCSTQTVYIYDEDDPNKIRMLLTQDFNNASTQYIDDRAYGGYDYSTEKRSGAYAEDGWLMGNGELQYYYRNNEPVKGWLLDEGKWYYLNPGTAKKEKGWLTLGGNTYFLNEQGEMQTGFVKIGAAVHHFNDEGHQTKSGWAYIDGSWRYFGAYNKLMTGWNYLSGKWYYLSPWDNGAMVTGWKKLDGKWYFFGSGGEMETGWKQDSGKWYYLGSSGAMATGWQKIGGKWYYLSSWDGGAMATGWQKLDGKNYYFDGSGAMASGWRSIDGKWHYFDGNGVMRTGWQKIGGKWYYLSPWDNGAMMTGWQKLDGKWYYFEGSGAMAVSKWVGDYYLTASGAMATNARIGGYYVGSDGKWIPGK